MTPDLLLAFDRMRSRRRVATLGVFAASTVVLVVAIALLTVHPRSSVPRPSQARAEEPVAQQSVTVSATSPTASTLGGDLALLASAPEVRPATSRAYPAINADVRRQPDLYASVFASELLEQDYRTDRAALLAWVQSEAVPCHEPLVVGLVPQELQLRLAVWTVSSTADGTPPPVPSEAEWAAWAARGGGTTVEVTRVAEPVAWTDAVQDGRITDSGVAARDVTAVMTTHWVDHGRIRTAKHLVTLGLTLELRPDGFGYGFVDLTTFTSTPIGG